MPGRKAVPDQLKKIRGTDQPCRTNNKAAQLPVVNKAPPAPKWFTKLAKKVWRDTTKTLMSAGMLDGISIQGLIMYCRAYANYLEAEETLAKDGRTILEDTKNGMVEKVHPLHKISTDEFNKALQMAREYGITPSSRVKVPRLEDKDPIDGDFS